MSARKGAEGSEYFERLSEDGPLYASYSIVSDPVSGRVLHKDPTGIWRRAQSWDKVDGVTVRTVVVGLDAVQLVRVDEGPRRLHRKR